MGGVRAGTAEGKTVSESESGGITVVVDANAAAPSPVEIAAPDRSQMDLVIVTGVSGGGRSTVARALENVGYYVVDNLPQALMVPLAEVAFKFGPAEYFSLMVLGLVGAVVLAAELTMAVRWLGRRIERYDLSLEQA